MATFKFPPYTGGLAVRSEKPNEGPIFENFDIDKDAYPRYRLPSYLLHATGALGTAMAVGIGKTVCPSGTPPKMILAKTGTTFYYTPLYTSDSQYLCPVVAGKYGQLSIPFTFSSFTFPTGWASTGDDPVRFETMLNGSFYPRVYMVNKNWAGVASWDGTAAAAVAVTGSPANPNLICEFANHLFVVTSTDPNMLYFSDTANPESWPSTNKFQVSAKWGPIVALAVQDDRLYIFTTTGILYLIGDPTSPYIGVIHPNITCVSQNTVGQYGSAMVFMGRNNNYYTLSGSVSLISDAIRGAPAGGIPCRGSIGNSWGVLTPSYFVVCCPQQQSQSASPKVPTTATTTYPCSLLINERQRFGYWGRYTYGPTTGVGNKIPWQCVVGYMEEWQSLVLPTGNGDVYIQPLMDARHSLPPNSFPNLSPPSDQGINGVGTVVIRSTLQTSIFIPEKDPTMTYRFMQGRLMGFGSNMAVSLNLYDGAAQVLDTPNLITATLDVTQLPLQWFCPGVDGTSTSAMLEFNRIQLTVSGTGLVLVGMEFDYMPQRRCFQSYP